MTGCEEEKYQMRLKIYNPSEVHAFISVTLYDYGKRMIRIITITLFLLEKPGN